MVCVCPPHTSISLYWRPGWHSAAIFAASACAISAFAELIDELHDHVPPLFDP